MDSLKHSSSLVFTNDRHLFPAYYTPNPLIAEKLHNQTPTPAFLQNLNVQLQNSISDEKLDVLQLTRLIGMSRSDLHRKLVRFTGMSTTEYIRHFRLRKAAELLFIQPDWSIYQVALEVGFGNQSYFSKRFKEVYGMPPMEWRAFAGNLEHM